MFTAPVWNLNAIYRVTLLVAALVLVWRARRSPVALVIAGIFILPFSRWLVSLWTPEPQWRLTIIFLDGSLLLLLAALVGADNRFTTHRWFPAWVFLPPLAGYSLYAMRPDFFVVPTAQGFVTTRAWLFYDGVLLAALGLVAFALADAWRRDLQVHEGKPFGLLFPTFLFFALDDAVGILAPLFQDPATWGAQAYAYLGAALLLLFSGAGVYRLLVGAPEVRQGKLFAIVASLFGLVGGMIEVSLPPATRPDFHLIFHFLWVAGILAAFLAPVSARAPSVRTVVRGSGA